MLPGAIWQDIGGRCSPHVNPDARLRREMETSTAQIMRDIRSRARLSDEEFVAQVHLDHGAISVDAERLTFEEVAHIAQGCGYTLTLLKQPNERIQTLADHIRLALTEQDDEQEAFRLVCDFLIATKKADSLKALGMIEDAPTRFDSRWDAMLAAVAEDVSHHQGFTPPIWTTDPTRIAKPWFFLSPYKYQQSYALATSPGPYAARGVFVSRESLESV